MTDAPKRIAFRKKYMSDAITKGPLMDDPNYIHYIRTDLSPDLVLAGYLAGLEAAGVTASCECQCGPVSLEAKILEKTPNPEAIAAIVARVTEGR